MIGKAPDQIKRFVKGKCYLTNEDLLLRFIRKTPAYYRFVCLAKNFQFTSSFSRKNQYGCIYKSGINNIAIKEVPKDELPLYLGWKTIFPAFEQIFKPSRRPRHARRYIRRTNS